MIAQVASGVTQREEFEQWVRKQHPSSPLITVSPTDHRYLSIETALMWDAWQAACNRPALAGVRAKLDAITSSHKFNVASIVPSEVHGLAYSARQLLDGSTDAANAEAAVAAVAYAIEAPEGMAFLRAWSQGDFDVCRREWPEAPSTVYEGAEVVTG